MAKNRNNSGQSKGNINRTSSTSSTKGSTSRRRSNSSTSKEGSPSREPAYDDDYSHSSHSKNSENQSNSSSNNRYSSKNNTSTNEDYYNDDNYESRNLKDSGSSSRSRERQSTKDSPSSNDNYYNDDSYNDNNNASGYSKDPVNSSGSYSNEGNSSKGNGTSNNDSYNSDAHYNSGSPTSKSGSRYQNDEPINDPPYDDYNHYDSDTSTPSKDNERDTMHSNNNERYVNDSRPISKDGGHQTDDNTTSREENDEAENNRSHSRNEPASHIPNHFETCTPFKRNYDEFRETLVTNSSNLRGAMISRSNPSHIGRVIDRTPDLRDIHSAYLNAGTRPGDRICVATEIIRDNRRYVEFIRFTAPNMHTFEDEPVTGNTEDIQRRELTQLHRNFTAFTNHVISGIPTYFGRPDSHDTTLANSIGVYCNNMIRLSRRERTMIPAEVSRSFASPIVSRVQRDWNALTNNNSAPALQNQDALVIRRYRAWARAVLLEHGNTTDEATINNYVNTFNGYRNY